MNDSTESVIIHHIARLLKNTNQSPKWHPEGNVFNHTAHVYTAVKNCINLTTKEKDILKWVAIFHDLGKIDTTRYDKKRSVYTAYGHAKISTRYVEAFEHILCEYVPYKTIDAIEWLVKNHMKPKFNLSEDKKSELKQEASVHTALHEKGIDMWHMLNTFSSFCDNMKQFCQDRTDEYQAASIQRFEDVVEAIASTYHKQTVAPKSESGELVILRGVPGSGKTTFAEALLDDFVRISADDWFYDENGTYNFDSSEIGRAHAECKSRVIKAMNDEKPVVVDNTFTTFWELVDYYILAEEHGYRVHSIIKENRHGGTSVHGVPESTVRSMKDRLSHSIFP